MRPETQTAAAQAVSERSARSQGLVVHPSGEVLGNAETLPPETLADVELALAETIKRLSDVRKIVRAELANRLDMRGRNRVVFGDFEVARSERNESVWDADELELVLRELVDSGVLDADECVGVIKTETTVSRSTAQRLVDKLSGRERQAVEACRTWKRSAGGVEVVRSIPLLPRD